MIRSERCFLTILMRWIDHDTMLPMVVADYFVIGQMAHNRTLPIFAGVSGGMDGP